MYPDHAKQGSGTISGGSSLRTDLFAGPGGLKVDGTAIFREVKGMTQTKDRIGCLLSPKCNGKVRLVFHDDTIP